MAKDNPARDTRLAEALRANLRRRKAQAREIEEVPAAADAAHDRQITDVPRRKPGSR